ncbi:MAG: phosphomannomutase [Gemmatimonadales bacterium]|nr:MAG: phosphomannomutase [Gemmatimonadales bacterium]
MSDSLIFSISGVRGVVGKALTPELAARYAAAFGWLVSGGKPGAVVVLGRDSRPSGDMFSAAAASGLQSVGCEVIDCGLVPTPTVQLAVEHHGAAGGIVVTASHNPPEWNALKLVGSDGVFLDADQGDKIKELVRDGEGQGVPRVAWDRVGARRFDGEASKRHIEAVAGLGLLDVERIRSRRFKVALDGVRGAAGQVVKELLEVLGCEVRGLDLEPDGRFPRPPEPLPENLGALGQLVRDSGADLGMALDPDGDRLALVDEGGRPIGEDYTLAFAVRAVLGKAQGRLAPVVCNLSTSLVVEDAARQFGAAVERVPVGEAHVARGMRRAGSIVGGEGNGGVILSSLHLGRDALVAAALVLDLLAATGKTVGALVKIAPRYVIVKRKVSREGSLEQVYRVLEERFSGAVLDRRDGLRVAWRDRWLHVRPSGTEPVVRLIAEAPSEREALDLLEAAYSALGKQKGAVSTCAG